MGVMASIAPRKITVVGAGYVGMTAAQRCAQLDLARRLFARVQEDASYEIGWVGDSRVYHWDGALQQISQDLPTHYREAIEAYFRKIATDK